MSKASNLPACCNESQLVVDRFCARYNGKGGSFFGTGITIYQDIEPVKADITITVPPFNELSNGLDYLIAIGTSTGTNSIFLTSGEPFSQTFSYSNFLFLQATAISEDSRLQLCANFTIYRKMY